MKARDLTDQHAGHLITWWQNGTAHTTRTVSIQHAHGWCYLGYEGRDAHAGYAHIIRDEWEVTVTPPPPKEA